MNKALWSIAIATTINTVVNVYDKLRPQAYIVKGKLTTVSAKRGDNTVDYGDIIHTRKFAASNIEQRIRDKFSPRAKALDSEIDKIIITDIRPIP